MKHLIDTFNQCSMHDASESILKLYDDVSEIKELDNRGILINRPLFSHSSLPDTLGTDAVHVKEFDFKEPFQLTSELKILLTTNTGIKVPP